MRAGMNGEGTVVVEMNGNGVSVWADDAVPWNEDAGCDMI